jgi:hypothetical protein
VNLYQKQGVDATNIGREVWFAVGIAAAVYRERGWKCIITSLRDGHHLPTSLHYARPGRAVDLRTRDLPTDQLQSLARQLQALLQPMGYTVILESNHLHIQFNRNDSDPWMLTTV